MAKEKKPEEEKSTFKTNDLSATESKIQALQRALDIETALDRVRSRTILMQRSEELSEVASVLFQQLTALNLKPIGCGFGILNKMNFEQYFSVEGKVFPESLPIPYDINNNLRKVYEAWEKGEKLHFHDLQGQALEDHSQQIIKYLESIGVHLPEEATERPNHRQVDYHAYFSHGFLLFSFDHLVEETELFVRFAKVFDLTYTRFLDLKRAEEQAREAQTEAALERIRAASMAMHKSEELINVATIVNTEVRSLGIDQSVHCGFTIIDEENNRQVLWGSRTDSKLLELFSYPLLGDQVLQDRYDAWKRKKQIFHQKLEPEELAKHLAFVIPEENSSDEELASRSDMPDTSHFYCGNFRDGYLQMLASDPLTQAQESILIRFTAAFEQAYTRFLDLQKAEAQARESQIQLALEKVRARTMAMHKSEELPETSFILFQQMKELGETAEQLTIGVVHEENRVIDISATLHGDILKKIYLHSIDEPFMMNKIYNGWKNQQKSLVVELKGDELNGYNKYRNELTKSEMFPTNFGNDDRRIVYAAFFSKGMLALAANDPQPKSLELLERFASVFDLTYTRFLDLQKAEAQAREAQIEAALERVRARTMAMHKSEELRELVFEFYKQIHPFGFAKWGFEIKIAKEDKSGFYCWISPPGARVQPERFNIPTLNHWVLEKYWSVYQQQIPIITIVNSGADKRKLAVLLLKNSDMKNLPEDVKTNILETEYVHFSVAAMRFGLLKAVDMEEVQEKDYSILPRFAKVFEQTYTRFLDLQKAEAQAREAEIQLALERVRARTMAMHHGDELADTALVLFDQLIQLGYKLRGCGFLIMDEATKSMEDWSANLDEHGEGKIVTGTLAFDIHPILEGVVDTWRKGEPYFIGEVHGTELQEYYQAVTLNESISPGIKEKVLDSSISEWTNSFYFEYGMMYALTPQSLTEEEINVLVRFSNVFKDTYRRFLDLRNAEVQTREAQIEAALERVRARTMAMHQSEELTEAASVLFQQIIALNLRPVACAFIIVDEKNSTGEVYISADGTVIPDSFILPYHGESAQDQILESWKKGEPYIIVDLKGEKLERHLRFIAENMPVGDMLEASGAPQPERLALHIINFRHGFLGINYLVPNQEAIPVFRRFALVFEQTYTRFLDLKKAEAQVRESQIEAAMERIRSRSLAMRSSEEIMDVITEIRRQIDTLGQLDLEASVVHIYPEGSNFFESIAAVRPPGEFGEIVLANVFFPVNAMPRIEEMIATYHSDINEYTLEFDKEMAEAWQQVMVKYAPMIAERRVGFVENRRISDHSEFWNFADFSEGSLLLVTHSPASEDTKTVLRKASQVFDLAYRRYRDLQKAEARTKEAIKQASLDRVRGEIASMRNSEDLNRITPLIWRELQALEVPFIRCGVFIIDEENNNVQVYLTSPEGKALAALHFTPDANTLTSETVRHWRKKQLYKVHWNQQDFIDWTSSMIDTGQVQDAETYQGASTPPESLDLHFVPFRQGMIYVGDVAPLTEDKLDLVKTLAEAFSIAYARYEDFKRLEYAKQKTEEAFGELKATQSQLIHAEKMASLGELTAGIAHEIQNPLNFVNNFSEVNSELIDDLRIEFEKGNYEEAYNILNDLKTNEGKIKHHGQRAEGIVKSMLQHSRSSTGEKELTDINALCDEYLRLAYHGFRAKDHSFNAEFQLDLDSCLPKIKVLPQDIGRVLLNLINNAFQAVNLKAQNFASQPYDPSVTVTTKNLGDKIEIRISDNGPGIPEQIKEKIFQPFFTTKPTGQGTGLGLSLSYDIITKGHGGEINVNTSEGKGSEFIIQLPVV